MTQCEMVYAVAKLIGEGKTIEAEVLADRFVEEYGSWIVAKTLLTEARQLLMST